MDLVKVFLFVSHIWNVKSFFLKKKKKNPKGKKGKGSVWTNCENKSSPAQNKQFLCPGSFGEREDPPLLA